MLVGIIYYPILPGEVDIFDLRLKALLILANTRIRSLSDKGRAFVLV